MQARLTAAGSYWDKDGLWIGPSRDHIESLASDVRHELPAHTSGMPTVVFCNRKGGVGKTLSTFYTGRWLSRMGRDVAMVDLDPQQGLWDIAALLGREDGVFTRRLRLVHPDAPRRAGAGDFTLVDTPPALDGSLPALNQADWLVIPVIPEAQEVAQLSKFLGMLDATRAHRPFTRVLGVLPVRYVQRSSVHRTMLQNVHTLAAAYGHRVLLPVAYSLVVSSYSLAGGLWRHVARELLALEDIAISDRRDAA